MISSWIHVWIPSKQTEQRLRRAERSLQGPVRQDALDEQGQTRLEHVDEKREDGGRKLSPAPPSLPTLHEMAAGDNGSQEDLLKTAEAGEDHSEEAAKNQLSVTNANQLTVRSSSSSSPSANVPLVEAATMEDTLEDVLRVLKVAHYTRQESPESYAAGDSDKENSLSYVLTSFCVQSSEVEVALICLQQHGIGTNDYTAVSVVPSTIHLGRLDAEPGDSDNKGGSKTKLDATDSNASAKEEEASSTTAASRSKLDSRIDRFYESIKSRMLVAEVVAGIRRGAEFNFDYLMLLVLAACIAFFGLIENSAVVLVASMLVSPLMGPILAEIFGTVIRDDKLRFQGIKYEVISLLICIALGLVLGLIFVPWIGAYGVTQWPTQEMLGRGQLRSLFVGVLIAVPSGAGVALSVLGGNAGSLVGVAISASLLPPAVNCGLFWAISLISLVTEDQMLLIGFGGDDGQGQSAYQPQYFASSFAAESAVLGIVSLALTVVNIVCIIVTGILILRLKEVTPDKIPQAFSTFWKKDVRAHRDYYQTFKKDSPDAAEQLLKEAREVLGIGPKESEGLEGTFLHSVFDQAQGDSDLLNIRDWMTFPASSAPAPPATPSLAKLFDFESAAGGGGNGGDSHTFILKRQATLIRRLPPPPAYRRQLSCGSGGGTFEDSLRPHVRDMIRKRSNTTQSTM